MKESIRTLVRKRSRDDAAKGPLLKTCMNPKTLTIEVSRTKDPRFGDYSTNAAMILAGNTGMKPRRPGCNY